jgi:hypothetical protein
MFPWNMLSEVTVLGGGGIVIPIVTSALSMETLCFSETLASTYESTRQNSE